VLSVEMWPTLAEKVRLNFACRILNPQGQVLVEMESLHVCTSAAEKPRRLPVEILEKMRPFLAPDNGRP
jgi:acyl-CoA thioesterase FadM